jgi:hypothetical protein
MPPEFPRSPEDLAAGWQAAGQLRASAAGAWRVEAGARGLLVVVEGDDRVWVLDERCASCQAPLWPGAGEMVPGPVIECVACQARHDLRAPDGPSLPVMVVDGAVYVFLEPE